MAPFMMFFLSHFHYLLMEILAAETMPDAKPKTALNIKTEDEKEAQNKQKDETS